MNYKAIGFDWGGVLSGKPGRFFVQEVSKLLGITGARWSEAYFHHNKKINRGEVTWKDLWSLVLTELGHIDKLEEVIKISQRFRNYSLNQDVLDLVDKLRASGLKVGLLSNNTQDKANMLREKGLNKHFDVFHISAETGFVKPEPDAFHHFSKELGVNQNELVFIDDATKSLSTAKECGYTPILFDSYDQLIESLTDKGILKS